MSDRPEISPSEWQVMNAVWENQPVTASVVIEKLASSNSWTAATIRTFLHRLVKKGALSYDCLLYTSPSPRDLSTSRMPSSA